MNERGLLVSVRNVREALTAQRAGANVIDLKEPSRGPLGRCDASTWLDVRRRIGPHVPLSAALGEWHEWSGMSDSQAERLLANLNGFAYAKVGPDRSGPDSGKSFEETLGRLFAAGPRDLRWIAVVYADGERCGSLDRSRILEIAVSVRCAGILVDTYDKRRPHFWSSGWTRFVRDVHAAGMFASLAGGLTAKSIPRLGSIDPDLFAVRGAACADGQRRGRVSFRRVKRLVHAVDHANVHRSKEDRARSGDQGAGAMFASEVSSANGTTSPVVEALTAG